MSEAVLDAALRDLGAHLAWPPEVDLASRIEGRLEHVVPLRPRRRRRIVLVAAAALLLILGLLSVSPGLRAAVFRLLGIRGAAVEVHETIAPPTGTPFAGQALLGRPVSAAEAEDALGFDLALPAGLGPAEGVFLSRDGAVPIATVAYREGELVVSQFRAHLEEQMVRKFAEVGQVRRVAVDGAGGIWVEGPHAVLIETADGAVVETRPFLSGNALLWVRGDVTFRLEGASDLQAALRIAETVE